MQKAFEAEQVQMQVHVIDLTPLAAPLVVPLGVDHEQVRR